jgi:hypothetical protein
MKTKAKTPLVNFKLSCYQIPKCISSVKTMSFSQMKSQEAESRVAATRKARRNPTATAAQERRASLAGDGAEWRNTNLTRDGQKKS